MDMAIEFAWSGELIDFTYHCILEGHQTTPNLFNAVIAEKCILINHHFRNIKTNLKLAVNVSDTTATIAFHDNNLPESLLKKITITNTPDLKEQTIQLWLEVHEILKQYNVNDSRSEQTSIDSYYDHYDFKQELAEHYTYEF